MGDTNPYTAVLRAYVDKDVFPLFKPDANGLNATYKDKTAIYGGCDEDVIRELNKFKNFAESNRKLDLGEEFPVVDIPHHFYKSNWKMKDIEIDWVYKQTAMVLMMKTLPDKMFSSHARRVIEHCCLIFLKAKMRDNLKGRSELTTYIKADYQKLRKTLEKEYIKPGYKLKNQRPKQEEVISELKKIVSIYPGVDTSTIDEKIAKFAEAQGIRDNASVVQNMLNAVAKILDEFNKFMNLNNMFFQLACDLPPFPKVNAPIRKFIDGHNIDFILLYDILHGYDKWIGTEANAFKNCLIERLNLNGAKNNFGTMLFYDFCHIVPTHLKTYRAELIFVDTPIIRTRNRAVYIPIIDGKHGVLATDAFLDFIKYLMSVHGIFQVVDESTYDDLMKIIFDCFNFVKLEQPKGPTFIDVDRVNICRNVCITKINDRFKDELEEIQEVMPVEEGGFTLEDFGNQAIMLNLCNAFPNVVRWTKTIYDRIIADKLVKDLNTSDMYFALEQVQLLCIFEQDFDLYRWLRYQKASHHPPFGNMKFPDHPYLD